MTERQWGNFFKKLEEAQNMVCSQNECDHFHCPASINGCYGDECAFQAVREAINEARSNGNK